MQLAINGLAYEDLFNVRVSFTATGLPLGSTWDLESSTGLQDWTKQNGVLLQDAGPSGRTYFELITPAAALGPQHFWRLRRP